MAEQKTKPTGVSVESFLNQVANAQERADAFTVLAMMKDVTGMEPRMWGPSIVGFGEYHYKYASGHEGDCCLIGFSPRKGQMSLYITPGFEKFKTYLKKLGKHKTGKVCLYIKKLADVDLAVLREMIEVGFSMAQQPELQNQRAAPVKKPRRKKKST
ncbi:MAG: DUF1801 domain-containing protein [Planctomycetes bacterium]|nr:DUF1801 domain-containing protein [Planctomycetota bacterium]